MSDADREALAGTLVRLRTRVDDHFAAAAARSPGAFACRAGCAGCCAAGLSVFEVEAAPIRARLARIAATDPDLRTRIREQADAPEHAARCALLVDDRCTVYEERPLLCRSHGLAVAHDDDDGALEVSHCPLNYRDQVPPPQAILRLSALEQPLSMLARLWDGAGDRVALADLARAP